MGDVVKIAVIGGSGMYGFGEPVRQKEISTNYGSVLIDIVKVAGIELAFLCRHGAGHKIPPHKINYQANIAALKSLGVEAIFATNAVGGISDDCGPGELILANQIIDYTWGRQHTFFDSFENSASVSHIDFTEPFDVRVRQAIESGLVSRQERFVGSGVYGCVQGPRLETAAEVRKYQQDGCTVLGMTGMPEAALARELNMGYASICFSANWAAGLKGPVAIHDVFQQIEQCSQRLKLVLADAITSLH